VELAGFAPRLSAPWQKALVIPVAAAPGTPKPAQLLMLESPYANLFGLSEPWQV